MSEGSAVEQNQAIAAFESVIQKSEHALDSMASDIPARKTLIKRLKAAKVGLAVLQSVWQEKSFKYDTTESKEARNVLAGMLPMLGKFYDKEKQGSSQHTLIQRRIAAFELAVKFLDERS
ncbi:hypothetical protein [Priestia filamentosa]|uniref:hypothetical protein n=1 Tax=Priestia filamentosa TaxID=1402861 RepID=UPI000588EE7E|nr:hypothetical protein [Priestia filamentosa]MDT3762251.1 hypothetical protein [Priestia filamentosa]OXS68820.1 hypothetical protein B1B01_07440 [Priestia filamentosa]RJS64478.1 hypothetical protein CJ485_06875 [Priestia filamentosa]WCM17331.1 hypothetical protein PGN40_08255 [Priestia filamentosa]WRU96738.1 hypothetical protein RYX51_06575 [Priestia filamentosa]